jgi:hypothetical protein
MEFLPRQVVPRLSTLGAFHFGHLWNILQVEYCILVLVRCNPLYKRGRKILYIVRIGTRIVQLAVQFFHEWSDPRPF